MGCWGGRTHKKKHFAVHLIKRAPVGTRLNTPLQWPAPSGSRIEAHQRDRGLAKIQGLAHPCSQSVQSQERATLLCITSWKAADDLIIGFDPDIAGLMSQNRSFIPATRPFVLW